MAVGTSLRGIIVHRAFGLDIPQTLEDVCDPTRLALVVYDMQVGIVNQIKNGQEITNKVLQVLEAARGAGIRVFFTRHMSLPKELMGVSQLRTAMAWQRVTSVSEVKPWFLRDAPGFHLIPEMTPLPSEAVFDKIMMSAFEGTPLDIALRDCGIDAIAIVGIAMEIGIEPTARHGADLRAQFGRRHRNLRTARFVTRGRSRARRHRPIGRRRCPSRGHRMGCPPNTGDWLVCPAERTRWRCRLTS